VILHGLLKKQNFGDFGKKKKEGKNSLLFWIATCLVSGPKLRLDFRFLFPFCLFIITPPEGI
jgi:hypothetical protein